jgi:hypothetical protein
MGENFSDDLAETSTESTQPSQLQPSQLNRLSRRGKITGEATSEKLRLDTRFGTKSEIDFWLVFAGNLS